MKLSIEAKVAAAVAAGFIALTLGAIAQGDGGDQTGGPSGHGPADSPRINTYISQQEMESPLPSRPTGKGNHGNPFIRIVATRR
jgi:hypothetical protein